MIETVFLDWGLSFGTGLLFAICGRREVAGASSLVRTRAFRWGLAYLHLGVIGVSAALYALNPDWMWMYWVPARTLPTALAVLAFAMYEVAFVAGFVAGAELERTRRNAGWALAGATFALITTAEALTRVRLFHFGTIEEFAAGRAPLGIHGGTIEPEMWLVFAGGGLSTLAVAWVLWRLAREDARRGPGPAGAARARAVA